MLRSSARSGLALALAGLVGACDLLLGIGHDKFIDPNVSCASGECVCIGGFDDCDDDEDNGCESELSIDSFNCGACGNVCANGLCEGGSCVVDCDASTCSP